MPQKKHKPEEIVAKLRQVDVLVSQGQSVAGAVRSIGVTQFTYYRWRKEFDRPFTSQIVSAIDEKHQCRPRLAAIASTIDEARPPAPDSQPPTSQGHHTADMRFSAPDDPGCATGLHDPPQGSRIRPDAGRRTTGAK